MTLALKELLRARLRYGLLAGAIALLVFLLLFLNTLSGTLLRSLTAAIENTSADVLVYADSAQRNLLASRLDPAVVDEVAAVDGVADAGGLAQVTLTADVGEGPADLSLWGFEPGRPGQPAQLVEGRLPGPGEAVVDAVDAGTGFQIGRTITLEPSGRTLEIVGHTRDSRFLASATAYTTLEEWEAVVAAANPRAPLVPINAVAVRTDADPGAITEAVDGVEALTLADAVASIPGVEQISSSFNLLVAITFVIVVLVVGFFFLILTVQKLPVFTALRALGAGTGSLARTVVLQIVLLVLAGVGLAALLLAVAVATADQSFPLRFDVPLAAAITGAVLACSILAGLASVRRIARLDPASAAQIR
jgi:putative ABC transport system permease protein